jgi:hypothetical protein
VSAGIAEFLLTSFLIELTSGPNIAWLALSKGRRSALVTAYVAVETAVHAAIVMFAASLRTLLVAGERILIVRRGLALGLVTVALWFLWKT